MDKMGETAWEMASKKINEEAFFRRLFENYDKRGDKAKERIVERVHIIYNEKDDLQNFKGSAWGMYNAVADFVSNTVPQRKTSVSEDKKLSEFFDGYALLEQSQKLLMAA